MSSPNGRVPRRPRGIPVPHLSRTSPTRTSPRIRSTMSFPDGRARVRAEGILAPRPSHTSPTRTSPRIPRNPYATASSGLQKKGPVGAVTSAVTSGGTTAVARGGGLPLHVTMLSPPHLALCPFPLLRQSLQAARYPPCHGPPGPLPPRHLRKNAI